MRRTKATLIYRRTKNLRAVQLLLGHSKLESTVRYLGIEVDDALEISEQTEIRSGGLLATSAGRGWLAENDCCLMSCRTHTAGQILILARGGSEAADARLAGAQGLTVTRTQSNRAGV